jgi:hypothetical protein
LSPVGRRIRIVGVRAWYPLLAGFVVLPACERSIADLENEIALPTSCADGPGTVHSGPGIGGTWRAADGPHRLRDSVSVESLFIEPGTLVCGSAGAGLRVGSLNAIGTPDRPILFTAEDTTQPWAGIAASEASMHHVQVEHGRIGARIVRGTVRNSVVRRIQGPGLIFGDTGEGSLIETVVDSACLSLCMGTFDRDAAVSFLANTRFHFEDSRITNSGADGLSIMWRSFGALLGGSIEGSTGTGLRLIAQIGRGVTIQEARPIRITSGSSYAAHLPLREAAVLLPTKESQDGWRGNARDTVLLTVTGTHAERVVIHPGLTWVVLGSGQGYRQSVETLELMPGADLIINGFWGLHVDRLRSGGTPDAPVTIGSGIGSGADTGFPSMPTKLWLVDLVDGAQADTSRLENTRLRGVRVEATSRHVVVLDNVELVDGDFRLASAGSVLRRVRIEGAHADADAALTVAAADVAVTLCEVTASPTDGVRVEVSDGVRINDCNIHGNAGVGLRNLAAAPVDARNNWWGDPQGPDGPDGDGVAGSIQFQPFRMQPVETESGFRFGFRAHR